MNETYIIGNVIHGDYDESEHYDNFEEALDSYEGYVAEGLDAEAEKENDDESKMTKEDMQGFYYIKKITEEIVVGGYYKPKKEI
jgi:hypothetical protein